MHFMRCLSARSTLSTEYLDYCFLVELKDHAARYMLCLPWYQESQAFQLLSKHREVYHIRFASITSDSVA